MELCDSGYDHEGWGKVLGVTTSFIMIRRDSAEGIFSGAAGLRVISLSGLRSQLAYPVNTHVLHLKKTSSQRRFDVTALSW
jgi:hypothetical protein